MWAITVIGFYLKLLFGVLGVVLSVCWIVQVVVYVFIQPPASPFLNSLFTRLDSVFGLFGVAAFALFCFYIIGKRPGLPACQAVIPAPGARLLAACRQLMTAFDLCT